MPLVIVAIVAVVYLRRGRTEQFQQFMSQAQTAVVSAELKPTLEEARPDWEAAARKRALRPKPPPTAGANSRRAMLSRRSRA